MSAPSMQPRTIVCAHVIAAPDQPVATQCAIRIEGGRIAAVEDAAGRVFEPLLALPAPVNAHDHGRAVRTSSIGAGGRPLESWLPTLALIPSVDPYLAAAVALSNAALGGAGIVMVHYTRT